MLDFFNKIIRNKQKDRALKSFDSIKTAVKIRTAFEYLRKNGYVVIPFLSEEELMPFKENLNKFLSHLTLAPKSLFYTSGRDEVDVRNLAKELSWPHLQPYLDRVFNLDAIDVEGCAWLLKPSGDKGELYPHQDSSLIDETKFASFYGWIPLQDVDEYNGTINVIPGSHRWGIHYRSLDVPWPLQQYWEVLCHASKPLKMKAGELLLFDSALIHGSGINKSENLRAALNIFCKPKNVPLMHYMVADDTPKGMVESYKITPDFFYNHDYRKRPDAELFPFCGYVRKSTASFSERDIKGMCK